MIASEIQIRYAPGNDPAAPKTEFPAEDFVRLGEKARADGAWRYGTDYIRARTTNARQIWVDIAAYAAIAAPDGSVVVWYGTQRCTQAVAGFDANRVAQTSSAAIATGDALIGEAFNVQGQHGARSLFLLGQAAGRAAHARAWGAQPDERDRLLDEFGRCKPSRRPDTALLLDASVEALAAAAALLATDAPGPVIRDLLKAAAATPKAKAKPRSARRRRLLW